MCVCVRVLMYMNLQTQRYYFLFQIVYFEFLFIELILHCVCENIYVCVHMKNSCNRVFSVLYIL